jgi:hypothetical protein
VLVAAAVCPHPPLLIPAATGAAGEYGGDDAVLQRVRAACHAAVAGLIDAKPDLMVVVGGADATAVYDGSAAGSLREFGIPFVIGSGPPVLPLSLTVGVWLLHGRAHPGLELRFQAVARDMAAADCLRLGARLARQAPRVAVLAMGDGSARKATGVPDAPDDAAEHYDDEVAAALAAADPGRLARLDPGLDAELAVAGRAAWQVLAGAARDCTLRGRLRCAVAPYGVSYLVASWEPGARPPADTLMPCPSQ